MAPIGLGQFILGQAHLVAGYFHSFPLVGPLQIHIMLSWKSVRVLFFEGDLVSENTKK